MKQAHFGIARGRGELALLGEIRQRAAHAANRDLSLGIGDDCALLAPRRGEELAVTTDLSIAGRHFRLDWHQPEAVGHRALARGLSDLAAMGARPVAVFLSLGLPRSLTTAAGHRPAWVQRFLDGLLVLAEAYNTPLAGGDLAESPSPVADIVLVGAVPRGRALLRSGARPRFALRHGHPGRSCCRFSPSWRTGRGSIRPLEPSTHSQKAGSAACSASLPPAAYQAGTLAATPRRGLSRA